MKILIDECVPHQIRYCLTDHEAQTVQYAGYAGFENGELIQLAERNFEIFITADKNLHYQQNMAARKLAIILLSTNEKDKILENRDAILKAVNRIKPSQFIELEL